MNYVDYDSPLYWMNCIMSIQYCLHEQKYQYTPQKVSLS